MAAPLAQPLVSPILVGRDAHVEALEVVLTQVQGGSGRTVLVAGEAGIGKSRLVAEVRSTAEQQGLLSLMGQCFEPDRALPYAPFLDLLRARFAGRSPENLALEVGANGPELVKLLPELTARLPGLIPTRPLDPEPEKRRLVQALTEYLTGLACRQPVVAVVEDLHWSDDISLEVVLHLARRLASLPILLLLTYRTDEPHLALPHVLAELNRARLATDLALNPLTEGEVEAMVRAIFALDRPPGAEFLRAVCDLSEGNPFFVEELLTSLVASGDIVQTAAGWTRRPLTHLRVPRTVEDAVRRRADRVSPAARDVLVLAAVAGRRFDFALLQALLGCADEDLLGSIKELIAAQLVVEESADRFAFRHALTRQAVYAGLLARERTALHRRTAVALERLYRGEVDAHLEDLAYHFHAAEFWSEALGYGRRAGEKARAMDAPRSAIEHFTRALEAAARLGGSPCSALYRARGQAFATLGEVASARGDYATALAAAQAAGDRGDEWRALLDLGLLATGRDYAEAGGYLQRGVELARELSDPAALAHSLNRLGNWHMNVEQPLAGQPYHEEALALYCETDDRRGIADTLDALGVACFMAGDVLQGADYNRRAAELFRQLGDRQALASCLAVLAERGDGFFYDTVPCPGDSQPGPRRDAEAALTIAREIGWRSGEAYALGVLGLCLGSHGDYEQALACLGEGLAIAEEVEHPEWAVVALCGFGAIHRDLLAFAAARHYLERALNLAEAMHSPFWGTCVAGFLASVCVASGDLTRAASILSAPPGVAIQTATIGERLCWRARVELALAQGDGGRALAIVDGLAASLPAPGTGQVVPYLWHLRGEALAALGRETEAESVLQAAIDFAAESRRRPLLWRINCSLGRVLQDHGRREDAGRAFATARATIAELAAEIPDETLQATFLRQTAVLLPAQRTPPARAAEKHAFGGLTVREREVACLVAQGKSNRAIAAELFVGERTVEAHVRTILQKLDFASRAQIAAWATERGLAHADT